MAVSELLEGAGVKVLKFCDSDESRFHTKFYDKEIISPKELKENYSDIPVIIGLDSYIAEKEAEKLHSERIIKDAYFACDPVLSVPYDLIRDWTTVAKKRNVFIGKYQTLLPRLSVLKFLGMDISYIADVDGEIPAEKFDIKVRPLYDLCYENAEELGVFVEAPYRKNRYEILKKVGLDKTLRLSQRRADGHIVLDPNLGHNIEYKGEGSVITLSTNIKPNKIIAITGDSTSDISYSDEISWMEQLFSIVKDNKIGVNMLLGGVAGYIASQELVKFLRDISFKKPDILISYSGFTDIYYQRNYNFISQYQMTLFNNLTNVDVVKYFGYPGLEPRMNLPKEIENIADNWIYCKRIMYAVCKEFGIRFYAIFAPNLYTKKAPSTFERSKVIWLNESFDSKTIRERTLIMRKGVAEAVKIYPWLYDFSDIFDNHPETVFFDHCHPTGNGNRILAEKIFELIRKDLR